MKRVAIFLAENQIIRLKSVANGRPVAELIRQAVDEYLDRREAVQGGKASG